jgi:hypothetical protein
LTGQELARIESMLQFSKRRQGMNHDQDHQFDYT